MNLVGHVAVALHHEPDAPVGYLVGCMLPDLAAMARVRLERSATDADLADGVAFHHASDAAFHASRWFNDHNQALRDALLGAGVDRGPSRACAHAGVEMLLDGRLAADPSTARGVSDAFGALGEDAPTLRHVVELAPAHARAAWRERLLLIGGSIDVTSYESPTGVAHRLQRMTRGRTRIELRDAQVELVARELARYQRRVVDDADAVVRSVVYEVRTATLASADTTSG